ncbi:HlyD family secretion protein [Sphingopyxis sp. MWB1]|uniref:HlyD family secretion protein n=1 Tax=Sphingopyxis sp. MWB1 TaxID=1537715 RepID=UPI000A958CA8|nr:efflux RND transporter periplasmic adaptor subunit [Sphingopyxis sp. MWB1]
MTKEQNMVADEPAVDAAPSGTKGRAVIKIVAGVAVLAALGTGFWLSYRPAPVQIQGMVDARELRISSKLTGRIEDIFVEEGQFVRAGTPIFSLTTPEVAAKSTQAEGVLMAAEAQEAKAREGARPEDITAARAQWQRAQAAADLAQQTSERTQRLYREGVVARQKADEARTNAIANAQAARAARAQYDAAVAGARPQDKRAAHGQTQQARGAVAEVAAAQAEARIYAPSDGEVGRRLAQPGELVPQGFPVFMLTETQAPWVTISLREDQLQGLKKGAQMEGHIPALKRNAAFKVVFLAPAGDFATWRATRQSSGFDVKSFEVRLRPVKPISDLRPGMTVLFERDR